MTDQGPKVPEGFVPANFSPGFLDHSGPYYLKEGQGAPIVGIRIMSQHMNYIGSAHGGVLATLADVALSLAVYVSEEPRLPVSTVNMATNFLSAARLGEWIEAVGTIDRVGKTLAHAHGSIRCADRTLMTMSAVFKIIRPKGSA